MMSSSALIVGLSGLGVEIAKNIILAGIASVTLCDPCTTTSYDLGGNFYLSEGDLGNGKSRAELCKDKLAELNQYVRVDLAPIPNLTIESLSSLLDGGISVLVISIPLPHATLIALNTKCRKLGVSFIYTYAAGVFGKIFCDFGTDFVVSDKDGENPASSQVDTILCTNPAAVRVLEDQVRCCWYSVSLLFQFG